ncbi:DUF6155 family protein [Maribacter sp. 2210JD10-5]|uniref:DUF6155 family protein n=1 Tax=Maribacter sp. 2210JD10-5 TaxID=3386272 RepID=UPI0039BD14A4
MSKRALKEYLKNLSKTDLETQILDLYQRFPMVKTYYDFVFNPKEEKLVQEAKAKISNEYFPLKRRRPKARRSVAQKYIKHFKTLGMEAFLIADVMCYNLEVAHTFATEKNVPDAFYKSMLNSFTEMIQHISQNQLLPDFKDRILKIHRTVEEQQWLYEDDFHKAMDILD